MGQIRGERHLLGDAMHTWRFTWQTFSPEKRHVRRQFEVFSMPGCDTDGDNDNSGDDNEDCYGHNEDSGDDNHDGDDI